MAGQIAADTRAGRIFESLEDEHDYVVSHVDGQVPAELRGTLYRNGPGRLEIGGSPLGHMFDGDGMLTAFTIADGRVRFRNRYVRTQHYVASAGRHGPPQRGFGTLRPGGPMANALRLPANVANTSVVLHAGELLALWEGGNRTRSTPTRWPHAGSTTSTVACAGWARSPPIPKGIQQPAICTTSASTSCPDRASAVTAST